MALKRVLASSLPSSRASVTAPPDLRWYGDRANSCSMGQSRGLVERFSRVDRLEQRVQMLLGVFSAKGVLPLAFKPAHSVEDLLTQHLDELEQKAE